MELKNERCEGLKLTLGSEWHAVFFGFKTRLVKSIGQLGGLRALQFYVRRRFSYGFAFTWYLCVLCLIVPRVNSLWVASWKK